jgi:hypothetical protein
MFYPSVIIAFRRLDHWLQVRKLLSSKILARRPLPRSVSGAVARLKIVNDVNPRLKNPQLHSEVTIYNLSRFWETKMPGNKLWVCESGVDMMLPLWYGPRGQSLPLIAIWM